jgi:hypothetical protein
VETGPPAPTATSLWAVCRSPSGSRGTVLALGEAAVIEGGDEGGQVALSDPAGARADDDARQAAGADELVDPRAAVAQPLGDLGMV